MCTHTLVTTVSKACIQKHTREWDVTLPSIDTSPFTHTSRYHTPRTHSLYRRYTQHMRTQTLTRNYILQLSSTTWSPILAIMVSLLQRLTKWNKEKTRDSLSLGLEQVWGQCEMHKKNRVYQIAAINKIDKTPKADQYCACEKKYHVTHYHAKKVWGTDSSDRRQ